MPGSRGVGRGGHAGRVVGAGGCARRGGARGTQRGASGIGQDGATPPASPSHTRLLSSTTMPPRGVSHAHPATRGGSGPPPPQNTHSPACLRFPPTHTHHTQDGGVVQFKTKRSTQLKKLMKAYCERQGGEFCVVVVVGKRGVWASENMCSHAPPRPFLSPVVYQNVRFVFDGQRIQETNTPEEVSGCWGVCLSPSLAPSAPLSPPPLPIPTQLDLESGDQIDAMVEQLGGGC